jgi:hypothetical protein
MPFDAMSAHPAVRHDERARGREEAATIRATCPSCGNVRLHASDLTVRICVDTDAGSYCFQCPECGVAVAKDASRRITDLLVASNVRLEVWRLPAELAEPHSGVPISADDILDFHFELETPDWFEKLRATVDRAAEA